MFGLSPGFGFTASSISDFNDPSLNFSVRLNLSTIARNYFYLGKADKSIPIQRKIINLTREKDLQYYLVGHFNLAKDQAFLKDSVGYKNTLGKMDAILSGLGHPSASLQKLKTNALALEPLMNGDKIKFSQMINLLEDTKIIRSELYYEGALAYIDNKYFDIFAISLNRLE